MSQPKRPSSSRSQFTRRTFLATSAAGAGALAMPRLARAAVGPNDTINVAVIGCGWRGGEHLGMLKDVKGVKVVALCDPDTARTGPLAKDLPGVKEYTDVRKLLEDKSIDAMTIAAPNHWHCLAAIWACEAGKDVYCEKPLSYRLWEGRALMDAARKHDRIVAVGTQQRSDPMQAEIKDFLHSQKALGKIQSVIVPRCGVRQPIGKRSDPLDPPKTVNYNLWLGPAQDEPIFRDKFHYDWHWSWNTGNGECGNWGVHILDDVINVVFLDKHKLPDRVAAGGGRVVWNDAGESPNLHLAYLEAGGTPILFCLSNLPAKPGDKAGLKFDEIDTGYVVLCEGGHYRGQRGKGSAVDLNGKKIRDFGNNDAGKGHMANFFDAVRAHDAKKLNAPVEIGHSSAGWAHVLNAAYRSAKHPGLEPFEPATQTVGYDALQKLVADHLRAHEIDIQKDCRASDLMAIDVAGEKFTGPGADEANKYLAKPNYRGEFAIKDTGVA